MQLKIAWLLLHHLQSATRYPNSKWIVFKNNLWKPSSFPWKELTPQVHIISLPLDTTSLLLPVYRTSPRLCRWAAAAAAMAWHRRGSGWFVASPEVPKRRSSNVLWLLWRLWKMTLLWLELVKSDSPFSFRSKSYNNNSLECFISFISMSAWAMLGFLIKGRYTLSESTWHSTRSNAKKNLS